MITVEVLVNEWESLSPRMVPDLYIASCVMNEFMEQGWFKMFWRYDGRLSHIVKRNERDLLDPVIVEVL